MLPSFPLAQLALADGTVFRGYSIGAPGHTIGETEGVSMNSKGHLFVYTRSGYGGISRGAELSASAPVSSRRCEFWQRCSFLIEMRS